MSVLASLREEVGKSPFESKTMSTKALPVDLHGYQELVVAHDRLTFLDANGNHYSVFAEASLEDLIDILVSI